MLLQLAPIRFPHVDIEADLRHVIGEKLLDLRFIPGDAGDGNHLLQKSDRFFTAVVDLLHKRLADTRTHLTSPKKIRRRASLSGDFTSVNPRPPTSPPLDRQAADDISPSGRGAALAQSRKQNFHDRSAMALTMRCGVIGDTSNSAPSVRSASLTALAMAAGGAMAPPSPMPLTPNSV